MGFKEQLKKARQNASLTQKQVAEMLGIDKTTYCGYETGKRQPDPQRINQISQILNVSGDVLLETGLGADKKISPSAEAERDARAKNMYNALVGAGVIKKGKTITQRQVDIICAVIDIIDAAFEDSEQ